MKKRYLSLLCLVVLVLSLPVYARALTPLDPDAKGELTLSYQKDGTAFPSLTVQIYRVAEAFADGTFELIAPFASYPVNIHDISKQEQWTEVTATLCAYLIAEHVAPDCVAQTDGSGDAHFTDLSTGLYLVREQIVENENGTYLFPAFMVYLPTPLEDGSYNYQVTVKPKCSSFVPKTQYSVTKLWQDEGNRTQRPREVVVDIYRDGVLQETQILNKDNHWTYTWSVSGEDRGQWTVVEREVPDAYKVTVVQNGSVFTITNFRESEPHDPPQTGDTFSPLPWILALCISGLLLILLGIYGRRRK